MMIKIMKTYNDQNIYKSNEYNISCAQKKKKIKQKFTKTSKQTIKIKRYDTKTAGK